MSPEAAKVKLSELSKDKEWVTRWRNGGTAEKAEFDRLTRIAAGAGQQAS
jgi:hypothetical protein